MEAPDLEEGGIVVPQQYDLEDYRNRVQTVQYLSPWEWPTEPTDPDELERQKVAIKKLVDNAYNSGHPYVLVDNWHEKVVYAVIRDLRESFPRMCYVREGTYCPVFKLYLDGEPDVSCSVM